MDQPKWVDAAGDAVTGDRLCWTEKSWPPYRPYRKAARKPLGERTIYATVVSDSYGQKKQQHTFSLRVFRSEGLDAPQPGSLLRRKGRNLYRNGLMRALWDDEAARKVALQEKHGRGARARQQRDERRMREEIEMTV